ncbi:non-specific lipid transfer protein GPI-anchored 19-like [Hibiscus syriacus]|uniref:non-specific lipid transfer protein GPI-anchored 19-like n=1 Tax=Hibiscus syriacus TaxID=106335 RepID=UPI0019227527|nr:non-specific lipid transfer protein GPI-anchored 19-like [Hibiscus syriacus]
MVTVTVLWGRTLAESDCNSVLITMAPCADFVTGNSSTPTAACCSKLAHVVGTQPSCLCLVISGDGPPGMPKINRTQALALPELCNVTAPSECKIAAAKGPAEASVSSPPPSPPPPEHESHDTPPPKSPPSVHPSVAAQYGHIVRFP